MLKFDICKIATKLKFDPTVVEVMVDNVQKGKELGSELRFVGVLGPNEVKKLPKMSKNSFTESQFSDAV